MTKSCFQSLARVLALVQSVAALGLLFLGGWVLLASRAGLVGSADPSTYTAGMLIGSLGLGSILVAILAALLALTCFRIGRVSRNAGSIDKLVVAASVAFTLTLAVAVTWLA